MFYLTDRSEKAERRTLQAQIRDRHLKLLFGLVGTGAASSRSELVRASGLSAAAVSSLTDTLLQSRLLIETGPAAPHKGGGRKPIRLCVNPVGAQLPVFTIGPLGVSYTLFDLTGHALEQSFMPLLPEVLAERDPCAVAGEYAGILRELLLRQSKLYVPEKACALLIAIPGIRIPDKHVLHLNGLHLRLSTDVLEALGQELGLPVFIGNSSQCLAYAQLKCLPDVSDLIYINITTGVGSGIIRAGRPVGHAGDFPGELGHITIELNGRPCTCGSRGCLEQYVSLPAILEEVRAHVAADRSGLYADTLLTLLSDLTLERIGSAYAGGVAPVCAALDEVALRLFAGIYSIVNITGIRYVAIGGIEALGEPFLSALRELLKDHGNRFLMRDVTLNYSTVPEGGTALGLAQYYTDHVFMP